VPGPDRIDRVEISCQFRDIGLIRQILCAWQLEKGTLPDRFNLHRFYSIVQLQAYRGAAGAEVQTNATDRGELIEIALSLEDALQSRLGDAPPHRLNRRAL
jgi:hypothetical protein